MTLRPRKETIATFLGVSSRKISEKFDDRVMARALREAVSTLNNLLSRARTDNQLEVDLAFFGEGQVTLSIRKVEVL
jgi:hypothetical protein